MAIQKRKTKSKADMTLTERLQALPVPDEEDREVLKGKPSEYIIGWNKVKYKICSGS